MKLSNIASLFKRNKRLIIHTAPNAQQWISNGEAIYALSGFPAMTPEIVLRIFDVPPDKQYKWICREEKMPPTIRFDDNVPGERDVEVGEINLEWYGDKFWTFQDGCKIYTVKEEYIKPLLDEPDYLTYHKRETDSGAFVLAVKVGMELKAIVCPAYLHKDERYIREIDKIGTLYRSMKIEETIEAAREFCKDAKKEDAPQDVEPETGEVADQQSL